MNNSPRNNKNTLIKLALITLATTAFSTLLVNKPAFCSAKEPKCYNSTEACTDAWYEYGDKTGDYGPIDSSEPEDYSAELNSQDPTLPFDTYSVDYLTAGLNLSCLLDPNFKNCEMSEK
jgi:hypothetical protein